jgi:AcrR family transcriptional regulator
MPSPSRKAEPNDTRERLLRTAERLFSDKGFHGTSLRDIGKEVGVANASLLYHFPSKGKLYAAVLERIAADLEATYQRLDAIKGDAAAKLRALNIAFLDWATRQPHYARIIMRELLDNVDRVERIEKWYLAPVMSKFQNIIDLGQKAGQYRACDSVVYLLHVFGSITFFRIGHPTFARVFERDDGELCAVFQKEAPEHVLNALLIKNVP